MAETLPGIRSAFAERLLDRIATRQARIGVVGLGYVGLPIACRAAEQGFSVFGLERDTNRIARLRAGQSYLGDVRDEQLAWVENGRRISDEPATLADCDVVVLCLPTPLADGDEPDLSALRNGLDAVIPALQTGALLVLESTTYPGTTDEEVLPRLLRNGRIVGEDVHVAYSPERVNPGDPSHDLFRVPKLVAGVTAACGAAAEAFYRQLFHQVVPVSSPAVAEMAKLLENSFRSVNIGLVNEFKRVASALDIDIWEVVRAASTKPFGFMSFSPGPGLGGHCLPVDPHYLVWAARRAGVDAELVATAARISADMPAWVAERVLDALAARGVRASGSTVLLVGLAYKPGVGDLRGAPALEIARHLTEAGVRVRFTDPHIPEVTAQQWPAGAAEQSQPFTAAVLGACDCAVLATDHAGFDYRLLRAHAPCIVDTRGRFPEGPGIVHA